MLRQVFVLHGTGKDIETTYSYLFGTAFSSEALVQVKNHLAEYIDEPVEGTVFNRPLFNFQVIYASISGFFFLFVTDLSDRPDYVKEELKPAATKFLQVFGDTAEGIKDGQKQGEFEQYIISVHAKLHPKIALVGPLGVGKTTIVKAMRAPGYDEKEVMNFGKISPIKIGKMIFDLWDFILPDNFSPLWNNYVRGCDVFLLVVESTAEGVKAAGQFFNLHQREAKNARIAVLCNKQDVEGAIDPEVIKGQLGGVPSYGFSAIDEHVKDHMLVILEQVLDLKKPLPAEFKQIIIAANKAIAQKDYENAIENLTQASVIAKEYQEMGYYQTVEEKIIQMETALAEKKKEDEREQQKIKAPEKIVFTQKIEVKALPLKPTVKPLSGTPQPVPLRKTATVPAKPQRSATRAPATVNPAKVTRIPKPAVKAESFDIPEVPEPPPKRRVPLAPKHSEIPEMPIKQATPPLPSRKLTVKLAPVTSIKSPPSQVENAGESSEVDALALQFSEILRDLGGAFDLSKCRIFVEKMIEKMGRAPTESELLKAAEALAAHL